MQNVFQFQKFYKFAAQKFKQAILAQLVEQLTRNEQVAGSSPVDGSHKIKADVFLYRYAFSNCITSYRLNIRYSTINCTIFM